VAIGNSIILVILLFLECLDVEQRRKVCKCNCWLYSVLSSILHLTNSEAGKQIVHDQYREVAVYYFGLIFCQTSKGKNMDHSSYS
jgi:hypothetical protein